MKARKALIFPLVLLSAALFVPTPGSAQFGVGQRSVGVHLGLSGVGSSASIGVSGEVAYNDRVALGAWVDTWSYGQSFGSSLGLTEWDVRYIAVAGTGSYHFPVESNPKIDSFVGLAAGYYVVNSSATTSLTGQVYTGDANRIFIGGFGGVRYAFTPNVRGVARLGFGAAYLTLGADFKL